MCVCVWECDCLFGCRLQFNHLNHWKGAKVFLLSSHVKAKICRRFFFFTLKSSRVFLSTQCGRLLLTLVTRTGFFFIRSLIWEPMDEDFPPLETVPGFFLSWFLVDQDFLTATWQICVFFFFFNCDLQRMWRPRSWRQRSGNYWKPIICTTNWKRMKTWNCRLRRHPDATTTWRIRSRRVPDRNRRLPSTPKWIVDVETTLAFHSIIVSLNSFTFYLFSKGERNWMKCLEK